MAYGKEQLRKAGDFIKSLDKRYADAVYESMSPKDPTAGPIAGLREIAAGYASQPLGYPNQVLNESDPRYKPYMDKGVKAAAAGFRYGLPAAGITLAGKGLIDLTGMFAGDEQTPGTVMP
jgi:hypothetical protein